MKHIVGYVVYYEDALADYPTGFNSGAFVDVVGNIATVIVGMMNKRPYATVCVKPVDKKPEWVRS